MTAVSDKHVHKFLNYVVKNNIPTNPNFVYGVAFPSIGPEIKTMPSAFVGRKCESCPEMFWFKWGERKSMNEYAKKMQRELKASLPLSDSTSHGKTLPLSPQS